MISLWRVIFEIACKPGDTRRWRLLGAWLLREESLSLHKSLLYAVPLYILSLYVIGSGINAGRVPASVSRWFCLPVLLFLGVEAGALLLSLLRYLSYMVFLPAEQRAGQLVRMNPQVENELKSICASKKEVEDREIMHLMRLAVNNEILAGEALERLATFGAYAARLIVAFVLATMALVYLQPTEQVFVNIQTCLGFLIVAERSLYLNLLVVSTLGFGDIAPAVGAWPARTLTEIEIMTSTPLLLFGLNMLVGLILEGSTTAWRQRGELVYEYLKERIHDARDTTAAGHGVEENADT